MSSWLTDTMAAHQAHCDRCGSECLDSAERMPSERVYCEQCVEIIFDGEL